MNLPLSPPKCSGLLYSHEPISNMHRKQPPLILKAILNAAGLNFKGFAELA